MQTFNIDYTSKEDIDGLVPLMELFIKESMYRDLETDKEDIYNTLLYFLNDTNTFFSMCKVEDKYVGCIVGRCAKLPFSKQWQASELIWYVLPEFRGTVIGWSLYNDFYDWATVKRHIKVIHTASPYGSKLGKAYEKEGYKLFEELYIKVIP